MSFWEKHCVNIYTPSKQQEHKNTTHMVCPCNTLGLLNDMYTIARISTYSYNWIETLDNVQPQ